jgi:hypothetical protein
MVEALAVVAFVAMFGVFAVAPTLLRRRGRTEDID